MNTVIIEENNLEKIKILVLILAVIFTRARGCAITHTCYKQKKKTKTFLISSLI